MFNPIFSFNSEFLQVMILEISKYAQRPYFQIIKLVFTTWGVYGDETTFCYFLLFNETFLFSVNYLVGIFFENSTAAT